MCILCERSCIASSRTTAKFLECPIKRRFARNSYVFWITPAGAQGARIAGIGVQFSNQDNGAVRNKIETYLAGALKSDRQTHTM